MLTTITIGSCVSVQGAFLYGTADGKIAVKVDEHVFLGMPVIKGFKAALKHTTDEKLAAVSL